MTKRLFALLLLSLITLPVLVSAQTPPPTPDPAENTNTAFVSLTNIPALEGAGNAATLPAFVNSLYKLAIGLAAVLAVLQIIRAGIMYMGGDSVTEKKEAKNLIALSIGGLVLILSPVIVFSIINPKILDLQIGGLSELVDTTFTKYESGGGVIPQLTEQGEELACNLELEKKSSPTACKTLGADWQDITPNCCRAFTDKYCCGRNPQKPLPPSTETGFRYRIAVQDKDMAAFGNPICVRYESELGTAATCPILLSEKKKSLAGKEIDVVKECGGVEKTPHRFSSLPTCSF